MIRLMFVAAMLAGMLLAGCISGDDDEAPTEAAVQAGTPTSCPVTVSNGQTPPNESPNPYHYGNGELWTTLWPDGMALFEDGGMEDELNIEWPWWVGVDGELTITGQRLDGQGSRFSFEPLGEPGADGYQPVNLGFSNEGCWEVTAQAGSAILTFVTRVVRE